MSRQEGSHTMTPQLHTDLSAFIDRFYCEEITDEEWALLQVHTAYCEFVRRTAGEGEYE